MPNTNPTTGIPYGAINGNAVPLLLDDIMSNGENETFEAFKQDLKERVEAALVDAVKDCAHHPNKVVEGVECSDIVESLLDAGINDEWECDECEYSYVDGEAKYLLGHLGGAPLIWVTESPYVTYAPQCSPCVPGAGDLDNLTGDEASGSLCYCVPPDCFDSNFDGADEYGVVGRVTVGKREYQVVGKLPQAVITVDDDDEDSQAG